ncbi:MAG: exodeoxyribonuclease VII large subunit [Muribaculaceae bacterium]|nr:exodeoxyribonuclease VII large subunit [Muribaculaceae bacterium]
MANDIIPITLREFNSRISTILRNPALINCWIIADLSDVTIRGGHCYLELIDKDANSGLTVAKSRGIIWANRFQAIKANFEATTGQPFTSGIKVMLLVSINYHESFGLSLLISDINPEFTLGDMERQRREILNRLTREGIINLNKELPLTGVPQRIAVISAEGAAGYGDFMNQLNNNQYGVKFYTALFSAKMQGKETAPSIIHALDRIANYQNYFDCVVIIRGGGATSDLNSFDDYNLAANIAQFPLPIITGIGHERDNTVIDFVAHLRVKTPTAAAEWIIAQATTAIETMNNLSQEIINIANTYLSGAKEQLAYISSAIPHIAINRIERGKAQLRQIATTLPAVAQSKINTNLNSLSHYYETIKQASTQRLRIESMNIARLSDNVKMLSPQNTLKRGYSITTVNGKSINSTEKIKTGDEICSIFADGKIISTVKNKL